MVIQAIRDFYALRKSKKVLHSIEKLYRRKEKKLDPHAKSALQTHVAFLHAAIASKNIADAHLGASRLEETAALFLSRGFWEKIYDVVSAIAVALVVAVIVRQMWFELYTIPTGSMRPTLKESDFLVVSKDDFGLNIPLKPSHFFFRPSLVDRGNIVVWTTENLDIPDADIRYFYLFPGKKQFVKRLMGKPGDTLYFYGGKIYGMDREGNDLKELRESSWSQSLEHIPFMHLEGRVEIDAQKSGSFPTATFFQMNQPLAQIKMHPLGWLEGEVIGQDGRSPVSHYSDLWGMKNYAKARLLTLAQMQELHPKALQGLDRGVLYLELTHHPSLKDAKAEMGKRPTMGVSVSFLPLEQKHLDRLMSHMTTCRFTVKDGFAHRIGQEGYAHYFPRLPGIPDGTYEIQDGVASRVYVGGLTKKLPLDHPLYQTDPAHVQTLYNLGIDFLTPYEPSKETRLTPARYAYFREGSLYLLNGPIVFANEEPLRAFVKREEEKQKISTSRKPYLPFKDEGAPLRADGELDRDLLSRYGLKVPEGMYLMLGDNHPMSADSREYGFVPESNMKGTARFLFSPPGDRFGTLPQPPARYFTLPTLFVWGAAVSGAVGYWLYRRRRLDRFVDRSY